MVMWFNNFYHFDLKGVRIDASHFFWIITYFLKFATLLELDLGHISSVLSFEIVGYLTYEAVNVCEQLEFESKVEGIDLKPCLRQMHLVSFKLSIYIRMTYILGKLIF
jgi:timeless